MLVRLSKARAATRMVTNAMRSYVNKQDQSANDNIDKSWYEPPHVRIHKYDPNGKAVEQFEDEDAWQIAPTELEFSRGQERMEYLDNTIFDDHMPDIIDIARYGTHINNPIILKSHGDPERLVGCFGNCGEPYKVDFEDENQQIKFFSCEEGRYSVCTSCGLWFYVASNNEIAQMRVEELLENDEDVQREFVATLYEEQVSNGTLSSEAAAKEEAETLEVLSQFREARRTLAAKRAIEESLFEERLDNLIGDRPVDSLSIDEKFELADQVKTMEGDNLKTYIDAVEVLREKIPPQIGNL